jgi:hypothetical protein
MTEPAIVFNQEGYEEYRQIAREVSRRVMNDKPHRGRWQQKEAGSLRVAWGTLGQDTGKDDCTLTVALYRGATLEEFIPFLCGPCETGSGSGSGSGSASGSGGDCSFLDMDLSLCTSLGSVTALVPAGYKAGPVGLIKMPICSPGGSGSGSGSSGSGSGSGGTWQGWTVIVGRRLRCVAEIPNKIECCPVDGLKITEWNRIWFFGETLPQRLDPCSTGSGSGS